MRLQLSLTTVLVSAFVLSAIAQPPLLTDLGLLPGDETIAPGVNSQQEHSIALGGDRYLVAWSDYRARSSGSQTVQSDGDVFGLRLNADGEPMDAAPFLIAGGMGLQQRPLVAWNGENWLVLFISQDPVGGYYEDRIRAVRVSPAGAVLDATPLVFPPTQFTPNTVGLRLAGQGGQWLVTRCIYHNDGYGTYLAGQRIGSDGALIDTTPVMLIDWVYGGTALLTRDGEYLAAGPDWSNSATIKARRIGSNGQPIGAAFNLPSLNLAAGGGEYYVAWIKDYVNLVGSRVSASGALLTPAGTMLVENYSQYNQCALTHDGVNWWMEWGASDDLFTLRIDADGNLLDGGGGVPLPIFIGGSINNAYNPVLSPRSGGGVHLFWYDHRVALGYDANVFNLPISADNVPGSERCISTGSANQRNPDMAFGANQTMAIVMVSEHANDDRVLVHFLSAAGAPITSEPIDVHRAPTIGRAGIAFNGSLFLVTWDEGASGLSPTQIRARRLHPDGAFADQQPFPVMPGFNPAVDALGDLFLVAGCRVGAYPENIFLHANRIDGPSGALLDGPDGLTLAGWYVNAAPRVRNDGAQWFVAAHSMWSHDSPQGDALLVKVPAAGPPSAGFNPTPLSGNTGDPDIAFSGGKYLIVWRMNSLANANNYIAGRIMNADGTFPPGYFTIAEAPGRQLRPTVSWDGASFLVAWDDQRNQQAFFDARTDVYGARVSENGVVLDGAGFAIHAGSGGDCSPALLSRADGLSYVASTRYALAPQLDSYRVGLTRVGELSLPGDIDGDGDVDQADLGILLAAFGKCAGDPGFDPAADIDGDGCVGQADLGILLAAFGS